MTVAAVYERHAERIAQTLLDSGLDPSNPQDKFKLTGKVWFQLHEQTRLDLVADSGLNDEFSGRHRVGSTADKIRDYVADRAGQQTSVGEIVAETGVSKSSVSAWILSNPGVLVQTPTRGVYVISHAQRAVDLAEMDDSLRLLMGH